MQNNLSYASLLRRVMEINRALKICDVKPDSVPVVLLTDLFCQSESIPITEQRQFYLAGHQLRGVDCRQSHEKLSGVFDLVSPQTGIGEPLSRSDTENAVFNAEMGAQNIFVLPNDLAAKIYLFGTLTAPIRNLVLSKLSDNKDDLYKAVTESFRSTVWTMDQFESALSRVSEFEYADKDEQCDQYVELFKSEDETEDLSSAQLSLHPR